MSRACDRMTATAVAVLLLVLAAVQTTAQECIRASTAVDVLDIVRKTSGHALICLEGQEDRYAICEANNVPTQRFGVGCTVCAERCQNCRE